MLVNGGNQSDPPRAEANTLETTGVQGDNISQSDLANRPKLWRADAALIRQAIRNRWPVTPAMQGELVQRLLKRSEGYDEDSAERADKLLVSMVDANIRIDLEEDKRNALEAGLVTERVEVQPVKFIHGVTGAGV